MSEAVIVAGARTPVGKGGKGSFTHVRSDSLAAITVREVLKRAPGLKAEDIGDLILGCAMPEAEQGMNVARMVGLMAGLPDRVPGMTVNRYCSSGLQSIAMASGNGREGRSTESVGIRSKPILQASSRVTCCRTVS